MKSANEEYEISDEIKTAVLAECFGRPKAYDALREICDTIGGRASGAESGRLAEERTAELLRMWSLDSVEFEPFPVTAWMRGTLDARVVEPVEWSLTALAHGNAPEAVEMTAPILDAGFGERAQLEKLREKIPGSLILATEGASPGKRTLHRSEKLLLAVEFGASGFVMPSSAQGCLPRTGVCHKTRSPIPSLGISYEDGARLHRMIHEGASPVLRVSMTNSFAPGVARNVIADLKGREKPEEIVLAGAHLDSWDVSQGAVDNGLGAAIVLEMARVLALQPRPARTLRFVLWAAEETGIFGSRHYVTRREDELDRHVAIMNFDMTGDPVGYWTPGHPEIAPSLKRLAEGLSSLGMKPDFSHQAGLNSDHQYFMLSGVPVTCLSSRLEGEAGRYYHNAGDTFDKVSPSGLSRAAAVGALTMRLFADAPERLYPALNPSQVRKMIDDADLYEALVADGYEGPAMSATP